MGRSGRGGLRRITSAASLPLGELDDKSLTSERLVVVIFFVIFHHGFSFLRRIVWFGMFCRSEWMRVSREGYVLTARAPLASFSPHCGHTLSLVAISNWLMEVMLAGKEVHPLVSLSPFVTCGQPDVYDSADQRRDGRTCQLGTLQHIS